MKPFPEKEDTTAQKQEHADRLFFKNTHILLWCFDNKCATNRPFDKFPIEECTYGTPYYITLEERDRIFNADLSATPTIGNTKGIYSYFRH